MLLGRSATNHPTHILSRLVISGRKMKVTRPPKEISKMLRSWDGRDVISDDSSQYDFLCEEIFAQDGVYEDIIAVDYRDVYVEIDR